MKTIANALGQNVANAEIRVCRGTYIERSLKIQQTVAIRGGFNCSTWERGAGFGADGGFSDSNNDTVLQPNAESPIGLEIIGATNVLLEGLTIKGGTATAAAFSQALLVWKRASVNVENCIVRGGEGTHESAATATVGIAVAESSIAINRSRIHGGNGIAPKAIGSVGVQTLNADVQVLDSTVDSGSGTGAFGARAIYSSGGTFTGLRSAFILGAATREGADVGAGSCVVCAEKNVLDIRESKVSGTNHICKGVAGGAPGACASSGISVNGADSVHLERNWISPGTTSAIAGSVVYGVGIYTTKASQIINNVIVAERPKDPLGNGIGINHFASSGTIVHNTFLVLSIPGGGGSTIGLYTQTPQDVDVSNNSVYIIGGAGAGVANYGCAAGDIKAKPLLSFSGNAVFAAESSRAVAWSDSGGACTPVAVGASIEGALLTGGFGAAAMGNVDLQASSFGTETAATLAQKTQAGTLTLATGGAACAIVGKGAVLPSSITTDILGKTRAIPPTIGAFEGTCP
jgi:hypothetical protein